MPKRTLTILLAVIAILAFATVVVASTMSGDGGGSMHTMQDGRTMTGDQMSR
jgi:hypothetical protein